MFDGMSDHDVMSWTAMIPGFVGCDKEAIELFSEMIRGKAIPNHFTFSAVLKVCTYLSDLCLGEQVYSHAAKLGLALVNCVGNSLVSMNAQFGWMENAGKAFDVPFEKNLVSYNAISFERSFKYRCDCKGCGNIEAAFQVFDEMTDRNSCWFGLCGIETLNSMYKERGIVPRMEHYACMVDVFCRSGNLEEAVEFISSMPITADALVWHTLLGACLVHGNKEIAKHAAKMIIKQDPDDPAAYILLSNLYSSSSQWEDVAEIRKIMKGREYGKRARLQLG
ncbi:Pentatricopeptide repeat [Dillenia turbinata]|uniref:Pentatricopeptide repeat n=1 Tax=Dillenia turbinata TaxID=194707 RepID=A0AAN8V6Q9_9MAGN